jgi:hypothetical protein
MSIPSSYSCVRDIPSLSGHISLTYFISSDDRVLSIGIQYLKKRKRCGFAISTVISTESNRPYCVQSIRHSPLLRPATNKLLDSLQLLSITFFESSGVVENVTGAVRESYFVLNVMFATLYKDGRDQPSSHGQD